MVAVAECEKAKSREAMARGDAVWGESTGRKNGKRKKRGGDGVLRWDDAAVKRAQAVAAASRAAERSGADETEGGPEAVAAKKATASRVRKWRNGLADSGLNAGQCSVVEKVADRVLAQEFVGSACGKRTSQSHYDMEPLACVLHCGPGTGGSFVIDKIRTELFERELGWTHGVDFPGSSVAGYKRSSARREYNPQCIWDWCKQNERVECGGRCERRCEKENEERKSRAAYVTVEVADSGRGERGQRKLHCIAGLALAVVHVSCK